MPNEEKRETLVVSFILAGLLLRLLPHPWNVTPLTAIALFSGANLRGPKGAVILFGILALSDLILGLHAVIPFTWGAFFLILLLARVMKGKFGFKRIFLGSLAGSTLFFLLSNLGVFLVTGLYPHTPEGFWRCYRMALPFFRNSLVGDWVYCLLIFGMFDLALRRSAVKAMQNG